MIVSYRDRRTLDFAAGERVKAFSGIERPARLKLDRMEAATALKDLAALPGNRLEALKGDRKGQDSIRINDQWRICFEWPAGSPGPGRNERTRNERRRAGAKARRADKPHYGDFERAAGNHGGYSPPPRPFLRHERG